MESYDYIMWMMVIMVIGLGSYSVGNNIIDAYEECSPYKNIGVNMWNCDYEKICEYECSQKGGTDWYYKSGTLGIESKCMCYFNGVYQQIR